MAKQKELMRSNTERPTGGEFGRWDADIDSTEISTQQNLGNLTYLKGGVVLATEPDGSGPMYTPWGMISGPESNRNSKQIQNLRKHTSDPGSGTWTADEFRGLLTD